MGFVYSLLASVILVGAVASPANAQDNSTVMQGVFKDQDRFKGTANVILPAPFAEKTLKVVDPSAKEFLASAQGGDVIKITVDDSANPAQIKKILEIRRPVGRTARIAALGAALASVVVLAAAMVWRSPLAFVIGVDNRYSNSQMQLALWFTTVIAVYLATVALRAIYLGPGYLGGVGITENLLALTGLSALSFGGAKVIVSQKVENATQPNQPVPKPSAARPNLLTDLVQNDTGQADLGDFQMILVTLITVGIFSLSAFHFLGALTIAPTVSLPDVDTALLASFGIGQGAYLVKKAALKLGQG